MGRRHDARVERHNRGPATSTAIAADLDGVHQLVLIVTKGGDGNAYDHADWGDARLAC